MYEQKKIKKQRWWKFKKAGGWKRKYKTETDIRLKKWRIQVTIYDLNNRNTEKTRVKELVKRK